MQLKADAHVGLHRRIAEAMLFIKQERIVSFTPPGLIGELRKFPAAS
jgi:hypothetical protein